MVLFALRATRQRQGGRQAPEDRSLAVRGSLEARAPDGQPRRHAVGEPEGRPGADDDILNQILPQVPAAAQPIIASIIAALSAGDANEVVNLNSALQSGALPAEVSAIVTQALGTATAMIGQAFGMIQGLLPMLPAAVQGPLAQVLEMVDSVVGTIVPTTVAAVGGVMNTVTGLLNNLVGGLLGGRGPVPST